MATRLNIWITAGGRPEPHPPRWRMDRVFRLVWTDQEASTGHLEFIPAPERLRGFRSHPRLEDNARQGTFTIHPSLRRVIDTPGPLSLKDDLADRLNDIRINDSDKGTLGTGTTRGFRLYASRPRPPNRNRVPAQVAPSQDPPIPGSFWKDFRKQKMPHNARNVWWRLLIKKLPSGVLLQRMIPAIVGPLCRICQEGQETDQHLLFSCPRKLEIWQNALTKHIRAQEWTAALIESLCYPNPPAVVALNNMPLFLLLGTIMATIWRYHHSSIREDTPFDTRQVSAAVELAVSRGEEEDGAG